MDRKNKLLRMDIYLMSLVSFARVIVRYLFIILGTCQAEVSVLVVGKQTRGYHANQWVSQDIKSELQAMKSYYDRTT